MSHKRFYVNQGWIQAESREPICGVFPPRVASHARSQALIRTVAISFSPSQHTFQPVEG
jgi:hypothetical protein